MARIIEQSTDFVDQETIRLEIVQQALCSSTLYTTMKDEIFLLCSRNSANLFINVFDRNNIEEVKEIIPLPRSRPVSLAQRVKLRLCIKQQGTQAQSRLCHAHC